MKRLSILALLFVLVLTLTGCSGSLNTLSDEELKALPYYSYLSDENPVVTISLKGGGQMQLQLFPDVAKNTVDNFITYIQDKSYSNSTFHRIIEDFMIQGGIVSDARCSIEGEFSSNGVSNNLSHYRGVISMARTSINDSATSQFFIVHKSSSFLNGNYAGFGGLVAGFDILDELAIVAVDSNNAPISDVVIKSIKVDLNGYIVGDVVCS